MEIKKRWLAVFVENQVGVLAKISGLCSSKLYNIESITVGTTADPTISRMTFGFLSNDATFEQIKKQMNRCVEVIKVIDLTDIPTHMKELMFIKLKINSPIEKEEVISIAKIFRASIIDYDMERLILQSVNSEIGNDDLIHLLSKGFHDMEIVRGGVVSIEAMSISNG